MANTKYKPEYCKGIIEFFRRTPTVTAYKEEYHANGTLKSKTPILTACEFPTFQLYADSIGVHKDTLSEWKKVNTDFAEAYTVAKSIQEGILLVNGLQGLYNAQVVQFVGKNNFGYSGVTENEADKQPMDLDQIDAKIKGLRKELLNELTDEERREILGDDIA